MNLESGLEDTIIAISTPLGHGGLGIVRMSGNESLVIAKKLFRPRKKNQVIAPGMVILGNLYDYEEKENFDEGCLVYFASPRSYTREDVVEISCHGSPVVLEEVLRLGIKAGARHAHPGEFTLRAYLRGRIDVIQAEAVHDLIQAGSLRGAKIAFHQIEGKLSRKIAAFRRRMVRLLARIEAGIEFPDEGLRILPGKTAEILEKIIRSVQNLVDSYEAGRSLSEGLTLAIAGRTNVGKSTLFNALLGSDRAIVTPYPGTTRDYLRETIRINGHVFHLIDMAGWDRTSHLAEKMGVAKGRQLAGQADGLLLLLDASRKETRQDIELTRKFRGRKVIILFNKTDLPRQMNTERIRHMEKDFLSLEISALKGANLEALKETILRTFLPSAWKEDEVILHLRQKLLLEEIRGCLTKALQRLRSVYPEEVVAEELRIALPLLGKLTGEIRADEVIDEIFSRFCVGK